MTAAVAAVGLLLVAVLVLLWQDGGMTFSDLSAGLLWLLIGAGLVVALLAAVGVLHLPA